MSDFKKGELVMFTRPTDPKVLWYIEWNASIGIIGRVTDARPKDPEKVMVDWTQADGQMPKPSIVTQCPRHYLTSIGHLADLSPEGIEAFLND